jgi:uroporphyrinogen decarboxylase
MLQLFEAMGMMISPASFEQHALPCMVKIVAELKRRHPDVPLLVFPRGACYANPLLQAAGFDVVTLDTETSACATKAILKASPLALGSASPARIQGNLNPAILRSKDSDVATVQAAVRTLFADVGTQGLIVNLGEGLRGDEDPALVTALVDFVHAESEVLNKA